MARRYHRPQRQYVEYDDDDPDYSDSRSPSDNDLEHDILEAKSEYSRMKFLGLICVIGSAGLLYYYGDMLEIAPWSIFAGIVIAFILLIVISYFRMRRCQNRYRAIIGIRDEFERR